MRPPALLKRAAGGWHGAAALGAVMVIAAPLYAPQLLAFPHRSTSPIGTVWSERPVSPAVLARTAERVRERVATSPLSGPDERRPIFLTEGGWRWKWLTLGSGTSLALSRPLTKAVIVNRVRVTEERITPPVRRMGERTLASVLAHEFTHGLIRRRYGWFASQQFPVWKVEGYCDHVAGESTLDAASAARLEAAGITHPALLYFRGRERVKAELARNGGSVDALFSR